MLIKYITYTIAAISTVFLLSGFSVEQDDEFTSQPLDERIEQYELPQSHDNIWNTFTKCIVHYDNKDYTYSIDYTPKAKKMKGKSITVSGFMLPLEPVEKFTHFILSKRTPTCQFCPPGEPNEIIEVFTKKPVTWAEDIVFVTGTLEFTKDPQLGLFFQMKNGVITDKKP